MVVVVVGGEGRKFAASLSSCRYLLPAVPSATVFCGSQLQRDVPRSKAKHSKQLRKKGEEAGREEEGKA